MATVNFTDFYILYNGHPRYDQNQLFEDEIINVIIQKYEMIIFTNKGDVLGDPDFGANLLELLYETKVSEIFVRNTINEQIALYIPELYGINYDLNIIFVQDPDDFRDIMFINMKISDIEIYAQIGN